MDNQSEAENTEVVPDRWVLIRDIAVLQAKLIVDGLRDFILVPVSLVAGVVNLVRPEDGPDGPFYELLRQGKRSEHWINLFGAANRYSAPDGDGEEKSAGEDIDDLVSRVEKYVVEEYRNGSLTRQAKDRLDRSMAALHKMTRGKSR